MTTTTTTTTKPSQSFASFIIILFVIRMWRIYCPTQTQILFLLSYDTHFSLPLKQYYRSGKYKTMWMRFPFVLFSFINQFPSPDAPLSRIILVFFFLFRNLKNKGVIVVHRRLYSISKKDEANLLFIYISRFFCIFVF